MVVSALSHGIIDAFTSGGHGISFFSPFITDRFFFPANPIKVCTIGLNFFNEKALEVFKSEFQFIVLPVLVVVLLRWIYRRLQKQRVKS